MIIFDVLSQLESYVPAAPLLKHVITIMDRSLPYKEEPGVYTCKEESSVSYTVEKLELSPGGKEFTVSEGERAVIITLNGDQIVSSSNSETVYKMPEGRFLLLSPGAYKKGMVDTDYMVIDMVTFRLPIKG